MGRTPLGSLICFSDRLSRRLLSRALQLCTPVLGICCHQVQVSAGKALRVSSATFVPHVPWKPLGAFMKLLHFAVLGERWGMGPSCRAPAHEFLSRRTRVGNPP